MFVLLIRENVTTVLRKDMLKGSLSEAIWVKIRNQKGAITIMELYYRDGTITMMRLYRRKGAVTMMGL